ncbi:amidohydrolase family protein [Paraburkholderia caffeinilytica]|uniref:amidohydrolase family protein n=1 Tax=Paraburkholderia caffeinilytica TaxID=1761016 RepID=UPI001AC00AA6|nr:amidohydrolase family protein [Paraburkholderia caffeinilytica]
MNLFNLEEAVFRMTDLPAREFGFADRGRLMPGHFADIVAFDRETLFDRATFEHPPRPAAGIDQGFVNGVAVWQDGPSTGARPGSVLWSKPIDQNHRSIVFDHRDCPGCNRGAQGYSDENTR